MSSIRFPSSLKPIVNRGYSQSRGSNVWRNTVQGGAPRQGRDTYFEPVPIDITLVVSSLGRQAFYSFLNNIHGGADSFIMPQDTGLGIQDHLVWITSQISDTTSDGVNWTISFTATAERTAIQEDTCLTANLPDLYGCYGDCLGSFLRALGEYMTTFPRVWEPNVIASFDFNSQTFNGISFSRASPGTYIDDGVLKTAAINIPRYEDSGLLVELASSNILTYSEDFTNTAWVKTRSTVAANAATAPDGSMSAEKFSDNGVADAGGYMAQAFLPVDGVLTYGASIFIKAAESTSCTLNLVDVGGFTPNGSVDINLITGALSGSGSAAARATPLLNGWWRVSVYATPRAGISASVRITLPPTSTATTDGVYVWGAQNEQMQGVSSYIPTLNSVSSRAADVLTLATVGMPKRVYREYTPLGSQTPVTETVPYTGVLCPPGNVRVIKVLND